YRMTRPDPVLENLPMLYHPVWNGFVEGPTWDAWWIQNSFGPSYALMPFLDPAGRQFVKNSQELWFAMMGNNERKDANGYRAPDGSLCDCARPGWVIYRQGDGRHKIHDWPFGFTTAGLILQSELLLEERNPAEIARYLPMLERCAEFIDSRRDPVKNIFLVGSAGNLLAPSYAGTGMKRADGSYEPAFLAEISVNYLAGLKRLVELEKMAGRTDQVRRYAERISRVTDGLRWLTTPEGYFVRSVEKDGTLHGNYGASRFGYFEATPNHDAMAFRIADDAQCRKIYDKIRSIPGLRPYDLILPNYPGYDDMYENSGLFTFGRWVNGGHWTTCEARMQIGYYRVGAYEDAARAFRRMLDRSYAFRMDNNLTQFGSEPYQPKLAVNCVYDSWGAPGGFLRGLCEYEYTADGLLLFPHLPEGIHSMTQQFPVWFGKKQVFITFQGSGTVTSLLINGKPARSFDANTVRLAMDAGSGRIYVSVGLGNTPAKAYPESGVADATVIGQPSSLERVNPLQPDYQPKTPLPTTAWLDHLERFAAKLRRSGMADSYACSHAQLILECRSVIARRSEWLRSGRLVPLPEATQKAADQLYLDTLAKLCLGLTQWLEKSPASADRESVKTLRIWNQTAL
ncbi:MAG: hypothetical protein LWW85_06025, partial [Marinilabiliales bacterium]|nr:hypothetical protein [Marinilabiliales bacterium]